MYVKLFFVTVLLFVSSFGTSAQPPDAENAGESSAEVKKQAAEMLRETSQMIANLKSPENRVVTTIRAADAFWEFDETQSRQMFQFAMAEIRQSLLQVDSEISRVSSFAETEWTNSVSLTDLRNQFNRTFAMRINLVNALSNHDAELATRFVRETGGMVTNPDLRQRFEQSDKNLLAMLEKKSAANDISKIIELGRESLSKGVSYEAIGTLQQIYRKDAEKGAAFGEEILSRLKSSALNSNSAWVLTNLIQQGSTSLKTPAENEARKKPLFSEQSLREMTRMLADQLISSSNRSVSLPPQTAGLLEKYAPEKLPAVRNALARRSANRNNSGGRVTNNRQNADSLNSVIQKMNQARMESQREIGKSLEKLGDVNLGSEEKAQIIEDARKKILAVNNDLFRFSNLVWLANQASNFGENDIARTLLADAERFVNLQPKERADFSASRSLGSAYAEISPERSFAILENMIFRLNEVIDGYVKFGEFNGNGRIIENGELLLTRYSRQFTSYISLPGKTLEKLAETDFARVKNLADKFNRPEIRVEIRLQIAGALLNGKQQMNSNVRIPNRAVVR